MLQVLTPLILRVSRSVDSLRRMVMLMVLAALMQTARGAGATTKRQYEVAAGDAATTLRTFVEQSGEEIVYFVPKVRGVTTNAVKGEFTAREVIDRMLANTGLMVVQDQKTGALMIKRGPSTKLKETSPDERNSRWSGEPVTTMKRKNPIAMFGAWLALALTQSHPIHAADGASAANHQSGSGTDRGPNAPTNTGMITGRVENAVTGQHLNNVRVVLKGTNVIAFTDESGIYRLVNVPPGVAIIEVTYTGLDPQTLSVEVAPATSVEKNVRLRNEAVYGKGDGVVEM